MATKTIQKKSGVRMDFVDFLRFFAAIMIIFRHFSMVGGPKVESHFFVEFFFMLTGFFIFKHFQKPEFFRNSQATKMRESIAYAWKRFKAFLPYTIPVVLVCALAFAYIYYSRSHYWPYTVKLIHNALIEPFMLPAQVSPLNGRFITPIWYLSVMVFFMPLVAYIAQQKKQDVLVFVMIPVSWIFLTTVADLHATFSVAHALTAVRGIVSMLMGGVIYYLVKQIQKDKFSTKKSVLWTIVEIVLYILMALVAFWRFRPSTAIIVLSFIALFITLSGKSFTTKVKGKIFNFLGAISLPLFMWHFGIIRIVKEYPGMGMLRRTLIVFGGSIIISIAHYLIVTAIIKWRKKKRK